MEEREVAAFGLAIGSHNIAVDCFCVVLVVGVRTLISEGPYFSLSHVHSAHFILLLNFSKRH